MFWNQKQSREKTIPVVGVFGRWPFLVIIFYPLCLIVVHSFRVCSIFVDSVEVPKGRNKLPNLIDSPSIKSLDSWCTCQVCRKDFKSLSSLSGHAGAIGSFGPLSTNLQPFGVSGEGQETLVVTSATLVVTGALLVVTKKLLVI